MVSKEEGNRSKKILDGKRKKTKQAQRQTKDRRSEIIIDEAKNNEANIFEREADLVEHDIVQITAGALARSNGPRYKRFSVAFLWLLSGSLRDKRFIDCVHDCVVANVGCYGKNGRGRRCDVLSSFLLH